MKEFWTNFFSNALAELTVVVIVAIGSYLFRKWIKSFIGKMISWLRKWAQKWKLNLSILLIILFESGVYLYFRNTLAVILSLLSGLLAVLLYMFLQSRLSIPTEQSLDWQKLLTSRQWILVFRPPDEKKLITFLRDGTIGEGRNQNENKWRNKNGKLELVQADGQVHSRFSFDKKTVTFHNTNDRDTPSVRNQIIRPM